MTEDQLTLLIIRQNSRILTLAMARARAIEILAEQKKKEDEAINQWLKGVQPDDVIRPLYR